MDKRKNVLLHELINITDMTTDKPATIQQYAMRYGTFMGIFWIFKFAFLPLGFTIPLLQLFFILLTCFVPILGYIYTRKFRNYYCEGVISFSRAFSFTFCTYVFAAMLTAVAHYIYFRFIDEGYLVNMYLNQLEAIKSSATGEMLTSVDQLITAFSVVSSLSPLEITFQLISQNVIYGTLLALPTALLVMRRKKQ